MTVKNLIKMLSAFRPEAEVRVADFRQPGSTLPVTIVDELVDEQKVVGFARKVDEKKKPKKTIVIA